MTERESLPRTTEPPQRSSKRRTGIGNRRYQNLLLRANKRTDGSSRSETKHEPLSYHGESRRRSRDGTDLKTPSTVRRSPPGLTDPDRRIDRTDGSRSHMTCNGRRFRTSSATSYHLNGYPQMRQRGWMYVRHFHRRFKSGKEEGGKRRVKREENEETVPVSSTTRDRGSFSNDEGP